MGRGTTVNEDVLLLYSLVFLTFTNLLTYKKMGTDTVTEWDIDPKVLKIGPTIYKHPFTHVYSWESGKITVDSAAKMTLPKDMVKKLIIIMRNDRDFTQKVGEIVSKYDIKLHTLSQHRPKHHLVLTRRSTQFLTASEVKDVQVRMNQVRFKVKEFISEYES